MQNNQYAISVPVRSQSTQPLARRADGFGFPGLRVDGNDPLSRCTLPYAPRPPALVRAPARC
uniref:thiamine pyrophosphate-dependent enzyme n=1 Tax=Fodinicola feengrottensis TaxID=435914 RepID=UPI0036F2F4A8